MDDFFKSRKGIIIIHILGILFLIYFSEHKKLNKDLEDYKNIKSEKRT